MALYTAQIMFVDGILLFNNQDISVEWPDADTDVDTVVGGAVGVSPGPDKCSVTITNAIPVPGADYKFEEAKVNRTELQVEIRQIGSSEKIVGTFMTRSATRSSGVGQASVHNVTLQSINKVPIPQ